MMLFFFKAIFLLSVFIKFYFLKKLVGCSNVNGVYLILLPARVLRLKIETGPSSSPAIAVSACVTIFSSLWFWCLISVIVGCLSMFFFHPCNIFLNFTKLRWYFLFVKSPWICVLFVVSPENESSVLSLPRRVVPSTSTPTITTFPLLSVCIVPDEQNRWMRNIRLSGTSFRVWALSPPPPLLSWAQFVLFVRVFD